jgi:tetratricopeptide (TPR) repeat protein
VGRLDAWSVLDHLGALVDKSLVMAQPGDPPRYRLLESGRAYALEKLQEADETEATMERHLQAIRSLFEQSHALLWNVPDQVLRDRHVADLDNLRAALDWAARDGADADALVALAGASAWIWAGARAPEGERRCALAMSRIAATTPKPLAARLLLGYIRVSHPKASAFELEVVERALALCREINDRRGLYLGLTQSVFQFSKLGRLDEARRAADALQRLQIDDLPPGLLARSLTMRAHLQAAQGNFDAAAADKLATLRIYERWGDERGVRMARANVADMALACGQVEEAVRLGREHVASLRRLPRVHLYDHAASFGNLSTALTRAGELSEAQQIAREAIPLLEGRGWTRLHLDNLALLALKLGRAADAARTLGRSRAVLSGDTREINEQRCHDDVLAGLRSAFTPDEVERLFAEGAVLSDEEAAYLAVGETDT